MKSLHEHMLEEGILPLSIVTLKVQVQFDQKEDDVLYSVGDIDGTVISYTVEPNESGREHDWQTLDTLAKEVNFDWENTDFLQRLKLVQQAFPNQSELWCERMTQLLESFLELN
jgi:hypothetical protein